MSEVLDVLFGNVRGVHCGLPFKYGVTGGAQDLDNRLPQGDFIVGDENGGPIACGRTNIGGLR